MDQNFYTGSNGSSGIGDLGAAALLNGGGMNGMWNSPFSYLMLLPFLYGMTGNGWGNNGNQGANVALANQIQNLSNQISDNANATATNQAIGAVSASVKDNGIATNVGFDAVASGICGVKTAILEQGAASTLANCQQTNTLLQQAQNLQNSISNGFTQIGFQLERNACDVKETSTANTQRIVDTLNGHWSAEQIAENTRLRDELATLQQTQALIAALGGNASAAAKVAS